ncbi:hypothetical protein C8R44DRAFT_746730 [Mycena epipterygia]|nr:hypothetical protein C8R44DRAFT_746730 [Mycena epipterygia]
MQQSDVEEGVGLFVDQGEKVGSGKTVDGGGKEERECPLFTFDRLIYDNRDGCLRVRGKNRKSKLELDAPFEQLTSQAVRKDEIGRHNAPEQCCREVVQAPQRVNPKHTPSWPSSPGTTSPLMSGWLEYAGDMKLEEKGQGSDGHFHTDSDEPRDQAGEGDAGVLTPTAGADVRAAECCAQAHRCGA